MQIFSSHVACIRIQNGFRHVAKDGYVICTVHPALAAAAFIHRLQPEHCIASVEGEARQ